jgi:SAM-dependent methyltransferase
VIKLLRNPELRHLNENSTEADLLAAYELVWHRKRILQKLYETWYQMIFAELLPGPTLEIGGGTGNFRRWLEAHERDCWTSDILPGKQVDVRADALHLPFLPGKLNNIVMIDTLHHLSQPFEFFQDVRRLLAEHGRIIVVEPYVSIWGRFVYRYLHHEAVDFRLDAPKSGKTAWEGNAAIPYLVLSEVNRHRLPLAVKELRYFEFLSYPLSGGFTFRSLVPAPILIGLHRLEQNRLFQNRILSLRVFAVLDNI